MIGYAFCASFCTHERSLEQMKTLAEAGHDILPIVSERVFSTDTRFGTAEAFRQKIIKICGKGPVHSVVEAEKFGPQIKLDALVVAPCTGNTLAKCAQGITDSSVTMAIKAQLRNESPVLLALCSNDALSANLKNIGAMLEKKNVYFLPLYQDDPQRKPYSLISDFKALPICLDMALHGKQYQPLFGMIDRG
ncbi:MAG: dipicolinate synthase subunit B [Ruminococcaceae bacterium]|nr:dipicolinate synthase subunit B [Oscillospiraceae bacterium]